MTKIIIYKDLLEIIHISKLTKNYLYEAYSNYQYDKIKEAFKLIRNYLYIKTHYEFMQLSL